MNDLHAPQGPREIERKYLLRALPPLPTAQTIRIEQGYLPGEKILERVRRSTSAEGVFYHRTIKFGRGVSRIEVEEACDEALFFALWSLTERKRIRKNRHQVQESDLVWEIDEFLDRALVLAEVELASEAQLVVFPAWLAPYVEREVTHEDAYVNANLARSEADASR